jgi:serine/threonine-protein kinase
MTDEQWQAAWRIYESVSSIPPERIASFLNDATADLQVQEAVRAMLDGTGKVDSLDRIGQKIGRYVLTGRLGEGGMGEVYAARDRELGRSVAVKLLARSAIGTSSPVSRFIHEAKAASALNHPNIVTIYEVVHATSRLAIVMELVDGVSLRNLCGSPLPVDTVLHLGEQVARALAAAHACGIVHCDIKPENLMVRQDGLLKVLDFGLAQDLGAARSSHLPAGTLRYMSPEQSRGEPPSAASDVFSLGIVLYELASRAHPFERESIFDGLKALNETDPPAPSSLNSFVPPQLDALILRMLAKDPDLRPSAAEVAQLLGSDFRGEPAPLPAVVGSRKQTARALRSRLFSMAAAVLFAAGTAAVLWIPWRGSPPSGPPSVRLDLDLGPDVSLGSSTGPAVVLSPDGTRMVFVSQGADGTRRLFTRRLDQPKSVRLPGTDGAYAPFFSSDGQWVGFFAQAKLKKTRVDGGQPVTLCEAPSGRGASWGDDGTIVAALDVSASLSQVPAAGGQPVAVTRLNTEAGENTHRWPQVLPGGKAVLFSSSLAYANWNDATILVTTLGDHRTKTVLQHGGMYPRYLPSGHLVYVTNGMLLAAPFDLKRLRLQGPPTTLGEVANNSNYGFAQIDFSSNGTFAYRTDGSAGLRSIEWLYAGGKTVPVGIEPGLYMLPRLSPDGSRLAYVASQGTSTDLWVYDLERSIATRLTTGQRAYDPVWSADGRFLIFQAPECLYWTRADGAGQPRPLTREKAAQSPSSFSPDGTRLVYSEQTPGGGAEIRIVSVESRSGQLRAGEPRAFLKTSAVLTFPAFSPDGHWLAYADAEGGSYEVYVRAFPDNGTKVQVSSDGGVMPLWSQRTQELFYRTADQRIMVAAYSVKGGAFLSGKPQIWFGKQLANLGLAINFDLAPDGKRFAALLPADSTEGRETQSHVMVATNFFEEVRRRLAGQGK